jgi:formamidopyrimidine-DNA glycosylase
MPELPEVDMMVRRVRAAIDGKVLCEIEIGRNPGERYFGSCDQSQLLGRAYDVKRSGKVMVFVGTEGYGFCAHNMMSGFWDTEQDPWTFDYVEGARAPEHKHVRVKMTFDDGTVLRFHDSRLFGMIKVGWQMLRNQGPDALITPVSYSQDQGRPFLLSGPVWEKLSARPIKAALVDQGLLAGVGNIYAVEALWQARINPTKPAGSLSDREKILLEDSVEDVLQRAIDRDCDYSKLCVYRQFACVECDSRIKKCVIDKRSTYYCPECQGEEIL